MSAPPDDWNDALRGKAKDDFNKAKNPQPPPPVKAIETATGRGSDMVKNSKLALDGPKPLGGVRAATVQQAHNRDLAKETAAAKSVQPPVSGISRKPVIELEHLEQGRKLHQKFQAVARQQDKDKGR